MQLKEIAQQYLKLYPKDKISLKVLLEQLKNQENLVDRSNYRGHVVGSGLIFSPDGKKILLIYHPTFERWQQPGGHWELDEIGPWITAERESIEETGVKIDRKLTKPNKRLPLLIESHLVPIKPPKNEPEHYHHAFWYGFIAKSEDLNMNDQVIKKAEWVLIDKIHDHNILKSIKRAK